MKQYYESEVLHHLMEREGFNIPSSVPKYESEIKAYLINQVKLAYPKLTDYEAEWLLYNYTKHLPADFPISSATNVTNASFKDVVPFAYQTAILKGQTLVNLNVSEGTKTSPENQFFDFDMAYLQPNTTYTVIFDVSYGGTESAGIIGFLTTSKNDWNVKNTYAGSGSYKELLTTNSNIDLGITLRIRRTINDGDFTVSNVMVVEGDHTQEDIPYFEGIQSAKLPVLTTTGKNLLNLSPDTLERLTISGVTGVITESNTRCTTKYIKATPKDNLFLKRFDTDYRVAVRYYHNNKLVNSRLNSNGYFIDDGNLKVDSNDYYNQIRLIFAKQDDSEVTTQEVSSQQIMLTSSQDDIFEPYKSNILTTPKDVELRGIGDVRDELDCLTGEITERIGKFVLDGSEDWIPYRTMVDGSHNFVCNKIDDVAKSYGKIISNNLPVRTNVASGVGLYLNNGSTMLELSFKDLSTVKEVKSYLNNNNATIHYQLATESIKTVELTTVNEKGEITHFMPLEGTMNVQSSGENIQPTFDMSVPVEATTQNLASFIDLEMEE